MSYPLGIHVREDLNPHFEFALRGAGRGARRHTHSCKKTIESDSELHSEEEEEDDDE